MSGKVNVVVALEWESENGSKHWVDNRDFVPPMGPDQRCTHDARLSVPHAAAAFSMATISADVMMGKERASKR